jgi:sterol desaturase/sphingolipid hydroxylase (fatty acid hydroxylase superfamily)
VDPLVLATPVFAIALVIEAVIAGGSRRALASGLGCVVLDRITAAWGLALFVAAFAELHAAIGIAAPTGALAWAIAIVGHDLCYYAFHRASHRITLLWAAHVVHHQSERYDFTVSLRQGSAATWISYAFYAPLALVVDAPTFLAVHAAYQIYQFFVHTRAVRTLGPLEWFLATPSHHRVHHGSDRDHLDRNYGGFFIVFDRLFGTFTPEGPVEPRYGVPGGFTVASPTFANTYMFLRLLVAGIGQPLTERIRLWFGPPEHAATQVGASAHPSRVVGDTVFRQTWLPLGLGLAGAVLLAAVDLPTGLAIVVGIVSIALVELATAPLDGR